LQLGCGAHIDSLVRTRSGPFCLEQALTLEHLQQLKDEGRLQEAVIPSSDLLPDFPPVYVSDIEIAQIRQGRDFNVSPFRVNPGAPLVKAIGPDGRLVAIGRIAMTHVYHPVLVLA
jgi:tRNA pseudouridine55 synthase